MAFLVVVMPSTAFAHAALVEATPADGAIVDEMPVVVRLRFSEPLSANSSIQLVGPAGTIFDERPMPDDPSIMALVAPDLQPGVYSVRWTAATDDGHVERGAVTFTVAEPPPTPGASPAPSATPGATPTPAPSASPLPETADPSPTLSPIDPAAGDAPDLGTILAVASVAIVLGFATRILLRGRNAP